MGHSDAPLTEAGVRQANELCELFAPLDFSAVYSSDSPRAVRTAKIVIGRRPLSVKKSAKLRERDFSHFEGMLSKKYHEENKESFAVRDALSEAEWWKFKVAGCVESGDSLVMRFIHKLKEIASAHRGKIVLVTTHGGPIRHLLFKLGFARYGSLPGGSFKNCGYIVLETDSVSFFIKEVHGIEKHENTVK